MRPAARVLLCCVLPILTGSTTAPAAQAEGRGAQKEAPARAFSFYPEDAGYDPALPTLRQVVGHDWGERITSPEEIGRYLRALADASPRVQVHEYARSWEGRPLWYAVVASEDNIARLEQIRRANLALADPQRTSAEQAERIAADNPVIVWLAYGVHGNEISSSDAALLTLYHLAAATTDPLAERVRADAVVIVDPMQNPDGRNRFVNHYRQSVGRWPDANPAAVELNEPWPGGRTNHYLFDLNRDWYAQTQPETRGKVAAFLHWRPQVYIDLHEMGSDATYYFPPQADPLNPHIAPSIVRWLEQLGRNNARWFDRMGFDYFTHEVFDAFYPGYGVSWPFFQGAVGATYEQASARGLRRERYDDTVLEYRDTVQHHFIASLSTAEMAASHREQMLRDFAEFARSAVREGAAGPTREIVLEPGADPGRTAKLVRLLMSQGVRVARASEPFANVVRDAYGSAPARREFPAGSYRIPLAQPAMRLVRVLLSPEVPMDEEFLQRQRRRYWRRQGDQIYDISGWSLPLMFDVPAWYASEPSTPEPVLERDLLAEPPVPAGGVHGGPAKVAYLVPWGTQAAAATLAALHRQGIRVYVAGGSFRLQGRDFPAGSLIVKVHDNAADLHAQLEAIAREHGADVYATDSSWVEEGINFGSNRVRYAPAPRIAIAWDRPTSAYSAGWARYLLEVAYETPVTIVRTSQLPRTDLHDFDVLVLPDVSSFGGGPGYEEAFGEEFVGHLKEWLRAGGTLVTIGAATRWLTGEKVGLLATSLRKKKGEPGREDAEAEAAGAGLPAGVYPEEERPTPLPGPILRARLDPEHWLAFGYGDRVNLIAQSRDIYEPLKIDQGLNVATYVGDPEELLVSGVAWQDELKLIAGTPFLMVQPHGGGQVVAFAEDPNFRAYFDGLNLLFLNAVMFGPAF